jgi:hypothetical protein
MFMEEKTIKNNQKMPKRKARILQSTFARLRRQASKFASKKHKIKTKRESITRVEGHQKRLPKQKRHNQ